MKSRRGCLILVFILICVCGLIGMGLLGMAYLRLQKKSHSQYIPPVVLVTHPVSGISAPAESYLGISATAMGMSPIISVELWLDGELKETQISAPPEPEGLSPFYAHFDLLVPPAGTHMLFVRAMDANGNMGQSLPVNITSEPKPDQAFLEAALQDGETLESIATTYAVSLAILQEANPNIGSQPPTGTVVMIPLPPDEEQPANPSQAPPLPGSTPIQIPNLPMLQVSYVGSPGLMPSGPFLPEPFNANASPPIAPTGLQVEAKDCKVMLRWTDNSDQEEHYYIYMVPVTFHGFAVPITTLGPSPSTGPAWYEFQPTVGGAVSLWVEAANSYGAKPSNVAWIFIPFVTGCPPTVANDLNVSLLDMTVNGSYDKTYCYISFENRPEQRIPYYEGDFIQMLGGKNQSPLNQGFTNYFTIPTPPDGSLDLSGKCLGWAGDSLKEFGSFNAALPPNTWNGDRQILQGDTYQIGISIQPRLTATNIGRDIVSTDPTLPAPYDLHEEPLSINYPWLQPTHPPSHLLRWRWDGDPKKVDDYEVFMNGQPYGSRLSLDKEEIVSIPECGAKLRFQVAARSGTVISNLSAPLQYDLPPCQQYLRVRFEDILLENTDDGFPTPGAPCETLDAYFQISVRDVTRSFWGGNFFLPLKCGRYYFGNMTGETYKQLYGPEPFVITIPLAPDEDINAIWIRTRFWDHDDNPDDPFGIHSTHPGIYFPNGGKWDECYKTFTTGASITDTARSTLTITVALYPNICRDTPPAVGW